MYCADYSRDLYKTEEQRTCSENVMTCAHRLAARLLLRACNSRRTARCITPDATRSLARRTLRQALARRVSITRRMARVITVAAWARAILRRMHALRRAKDWTRTTRNKNSWQHSEVE